MRLLIVNKDQLEYVSKLQTPETFGKNTKQSDHGNKTWRKQRLLQMRELAKHVKETGGFNDQASNDNRYYGILKLRMKR